MDKKKIKKIIGLIIILLCLGVKTASGCICSKPKLEKAFEESVAVFRGKVIKVNSSNRIWMKVLEEIGKDEALMEVSEIWKGDVNSRQWIYTDSTLCEFDFKLGQEYVVYAQKTAFGNYHAYKCGGTKYIEYADRDLHFLGNGYLTKAMLSTYTNKKVLFVCMFFTFVLLLIAFIGSKLVAKLRGNIS